jgi:hypothetical protein
MGGIAMMQTVEVEIRVGADGKSTPLRVMWNGKWITVTDVGRRWSDDRGDHWLVMIYPPQRVLEIIHTPAGDWKAHEPGGGRVSV